MIGKATTGQSTAPVDLCRQVISVRDLFEAAWRTGQEPRIECCLTEISETGRSLLLRELIRLELELRHGRGETPLQIEYQARFPAETQLVDSVFSRWNTRDASQTGGSDPDRTTDQDGSANGCENGVNQMADSATAIPQTIGKYVVTKKLDEGGQGIVYRVLQPDLAGEFVLKIARKPMSVDPSVRDQFLEEGQLLARLKHPNLVPVIDLGFHEDRPFLVLEYVVGRTFQSFVNEGRPSPRMAAELVLELASAVAYLHSQGVIHQDIKPRNVLLDDRDRPRMIDFGLARLRHPWSNDLTGLNGGTLAYMAPEQSLGEEAKIGPRTDIFGLGALLYFLLTGRPLYEAQSREALVQLAREAAIVRPRQFQPRTPRALERICLKALAREPEHRYQSAADLGRSLRRFLSRRKVIALAFGGAIALPLVAGMAWAVWHHQQANPTMPVSRELPASVADFRISAFEVEHYRGDRPDLLGLLGAETLAARVNDDVRVHVRLTAPAHSYLLALNADGTVELRYPAKATTRPPLSAEITYPLDPAVYFGLTDGSGLQAFVLVASRRPLPAFAEWASGAVIPWSRISGEADGVWRYDGKRFGLVLGQRGEERRKSGPPGPFVDVCLYLKAQPQVDAMQALSFPVKATD